MKAFEDETGTSFTLKSHDIHDYPYHLKIIRQKLTSGLDKVLVNSQDEIMMAFQEVWEKAWDLETLERKAKGEEGYGWHTVDVHATMQNMMARITNRTFVGTQLCMFGTGDVEGWQNSQC